MTHGGMHLAMVTICSTLSASWPIAVQVSDPLGNIVARIPLGVTLPAFSEWALPTALWRMMDKMLGTGVGWNEWPTQPVSNYGR